ncbi:MAG: oxidoreductase, partial [Gordonibacter pamelaeae]
MTKAILINYEYCTGCHSCEVACKKELGLPKGEFGIKLTETGPYEYEGEEGPGAGSGRGSPSSPRRATCARRARQAGKMPMCVQHCQAWCMYYGEAEDLVKKMDGETRWALY